MKPKQAEKFYTAVRDGLNQTWYGNIWLNPPYAKDLLPKFADKFAESEFNQAIVLVNNATETKWFLKFIGRASAIVFSTGRVDCKTPEKIPVNRCKVQRLSIRATIKKIPYGQRLMYERLVDDLSKIGKPSISILAEHYCKNPAEEVDAAKCVVREFYWKGEWRKCQREPPVLLGDAIKKFISKLEAMA